MIIVIHEADLYAVWRYHITEAVVIVAQKFGEVMQQNKENAKRTLVKQLHWLIQLGVPEERRQEFEQVHQ